MDFDFNEEQNILKKSAQDFLKKECPKEMVREWLESESGYSPECWQKMADMGWLGLMFPQAYDGSECSFLDLVIILEEMGYQICPGPYFSTKILAGLPIMSGGSDAQKKAFLPRIAAGEVIMTLALTEAQADMQASSIQASARQEGDGYLISGTKLFVSNAHISDYILCAARTGDGGRPEEGITLFIVDAKQPGVKVTPLKTLSRDKQCEVVFDQVSVPGENILGEPGNAWPLIEEALVRASVAQSAQMVGGAQAVLELALDYAKARVQFDRPIGSFQAIQHHFANMSIDINSARMLCMKAASMMAAGLPAEKEAAMAKARAGQSFRHVTILGHQIFGGIGFTWEHDMHLYHRRSITEDQMFGDIHCQREKVAKAIGLMGP